MPTPVLPIPAGTSFVVNASGSGGDYVFSLHAVGSDPSALTLDFSLTLHIVDFSLGPPSPSSVSVVPGGTSAPVSLLVSALGSFAGTVALSCSGLPAGANCQFQPSNTVNPISGNPASVTLTVSTSSSTPLGTSQITIVASTPGEPDKDKTQTLTLTVGAAPDYSLAIANPSLTTNVNSPAIFNGTLTSINGYASPVNLTCGAGAPPSCVASPVSGTPIGSGMPFTVTVSSSISQAYSFNITGVGSDLAAITHSAAVNFTALPVQSFDFTLGVTPSSLSVVVGKPALYSLDVSPTTGTFPNNVSFSCSTLPALTTCSFNPAQVPTGNGDSVITLTISTSAPIPRSTRIVALILAMTLPLAGVLWRGRRQRVLTTTSKKRGRMVSTLSLLLSVLACVSCGGGLQGNGGGGGSGSPGTPIGTYNITVTRLPVPSRTTLRSV